VGDVIYLKKRSDGKFIELRRDTVSSTAIALAANATAPDVTAGDKFNEYRVLYLKFVFIADTGN
jgi:hypothetical protein